MPHMLLRKFTVRTDSVLPMLSNSASRGVAAAGVVQNDVLQSAATFAHWTLHFLKTNSWIAVWH
eukprot:11721247-Karenia_brevis.AAC.1